MLKNITIESLSPRAACLSFAALMAFGTTHATAARFTDLGTLGGSDSYATAINNAGQIVGRFDTANGSGPTHAALWNGTTATDLGTLLGGSYSYASGINLAGVVVGSSGVVDSGYSHAVLWYNGQIVDLNNLVDSSVLGAGWIMTSANAINDNDVIVGQAQNLNTGATHAFELSGVTLSAPVPEPESYALALVSLGVMGFIARRAKKQPDHV